MDLSQVSMNTLLAMLMVGGLAWSVIRARNNLVVLRNQVLNNRSVVHVYMEQRAELIPQLVNAVKKHMAYESETLEKLVKLSTDFEKIGNKSAKMIGHDQRVEQALGKLIAFAASVPALTSSGPFQEMMRQLGMIERDIANARRMCNFATTEYNNAVQMLPSGVVAFILKYRTMKVFKIDESRKIAPKVFAE